VKDASDVENVVDEEDIVDVDDPTDTRDGVAIRVLEAPVGMKNEGTNELEPTNTVISGSIERPLKQLPAGTTFPSGQPFA